MGVVLQVPKTHYEMTPVTIYGRTYDVVDGAVTIPTRQGNMVVTLEKVTKRKDWFYRMRRGVHSFKMVDFNQMVEALCITIPESDILK